MQKFEIAKFPPGSDVKVVDGRIEATLPDGTFETYEAVPNGCGINIVKTVVPLNIEISIGVAPSGDHPPQALPSLPPKTR